MAGTGVSQPTQEGRHNDVKAIAREYLDPATFVTVVAGPLDRIRAARHPRWPVALEEVEAELGRP